jgi:hypothetical protein
MAAFIFICHILSFPAFAHAEIKVSGGPYWRLRYEYWRNWKDMDNGLKDNRNHFILKTALWGKADFNANTSLFAKLCNEFKAYTYFGGTASVIPDKTADKKGYHFDINEVIFENLYLDESLFLGLPVDLRLGRQDFAGMYGEGFLVMEGTPQDGPRTLYFNAAKTSWRLNKGNTIDLIYINNPRDEEFLPVMNRTELTVSSNPSLDKQPQLLNTTDEEASVVYWKNKDIKDLALEGYYIFKSEAEEGGYGYQTQKGRISTLGSFASYALGTLTFRGQMANQFGSYGHNSRRGIGGYVFVENSFKGSAWNPKASIGFVYLSGDKEETADNEGWDPLFSRWEWLSPMYARSMCAETGILGYWTNMRIFRVNLFMKPTEKINIYLWYNFLQANEQVAPSAILSGNGKNRGHLPQVKLEYMFNKNVTTFFWMEYLIPGDFYKDRDPAIFLRTELQLKF